MMLEAKETPQQEQSYTYFVAFSYSGGVGNANLIMGSAWDIRTTQKAADLIKQLRPDLDGIAITFFALLPPTGEDG